MNSNKCAECYQYKNGKWCQKYNTFYCYSCWNKWNHNSYITLKKIITKNICNLTLAGRSVQHFVELGCGMGYDIKNYSHHISKNLDLVDSSVDAIEHAKQYLINGLVNTRYLNMNFLINTKLWELYSNESVDAIYSSMLIHYIPFSKIDDLLSNVTHIMKPGSIFFGIYTHVNRLPTKIKIKSNHYNHSFSYVPNNHISFEEHQSTGIYYSYHPTDLMNIGIAHELEPINYGLYWNDFNKISKKINNNNDVDFFNQNYVSFAFVKHGMTKPLSLKQCTIGICTGSYDPIHNNHLGMWKYLLDNYLDYLMIYPNSCNPFKPNLNQESLSDRINMLNLAIIDYKLDNQVYIRNDSIGGNWIGRIENCYKVLGEYPNSKISLIVGYDSFVQSITKSNQNGKHQGIYQIIDTPFNIMVLPRIGSTSIIIPRELQSITDVIDDYHDPMELSSSIVRGAIHNDQSTTLMLTPSVQSYINEHHMYK